MKILLLADNTHPTTAVSDHILAITANSPHQWHVENPLINKVLHKTDLRPFDAIGLHYSIRPHNSYYLPKQLYQAIKRYPGVKFQFLQDEYQQARIAEHSIIDLNIDILFTLLRPDYYHLAYPELRMASVKLITILTGYVPAALSQLNPPVIAARKLDIFYRSRAVPFFLGTLGQEKVKIAEAVSQLARQYNLAVDISVREEDRIYGDAWFKHLMTSKAVLGTESGSSIWDYSGEIQQRILRFQQKHPRMSFNELHAKVLAEHEGNLIYSAVSPRVFEAAATKTTMIMFPGWYSGVCEAEKHYIVLEKDFSNFAEVVDKLRDDNYLQQIAENAYQDLILSGSYNPEQLGKLVCSELETCAHTKTIGIQQQNSRQELDENSKRYKLLNYYYCLKTEIKFVITNFLRLCFKSPEPLSKRLTHLYYGAKRYLLYLSPRLRSLISKQFHHN